MHNHKLPSIDILLILSIYNNIICTIYHKFPMKVSGSLFKLIKCLTKQEKRYLKLHYINNTQRSTNYAKLFDAIEKQKVYDEKKIKETFKTEKFTKQLNVTKQNLQELILRGLRNYNAKLSASIKITSSIQNIEILYKKGLYDVAETETKKIKQLAYKTENHFVVPLILHWKKNLFIKKEPSIQKYRQVAKINKESQQISKLISNYFDYWQLKEQVFMQVGSSMNEMKKPKYDAILSSPYFQSNKALSEGATLNYFQSKVYFFLLSKQYSEAISHFKHFISYLEGSALIFKYEQMYVIELSNLLLCSMFADKPVEFQKTLDKIKNTSPDDPAAKMTKWFSCKCITFLYYLRLNQYDTAYSFIREIESGTEQYAKYFSWYNIQGVLFQIGNLHFTKKEFSVCIKKINTLLHTPGIDIRGDIYRFSMLLLAFSHHEKENDTVCQNILTEIKKIKGKKYKSEQLIVSFLCDQLKNEYDNNSRLLFLKKYKKQYHLLQQQLEEQEIKEYFDFNSYLDTQIELLL